jgi:hypothetical protein
MRLEYDGKTSHAQQVTGHRLPQFTCSHTRFFEFSKEELVV